MAESKHISSNLLKQTVNPQRALPDGSGRPPLGDRECADDGEGRCPLWDGYIIDVTIPLE